MLLLCKLQAGSNQVRVYVLFRMEHSSKKTLSTGKILYFLMVMRRATKKQKINLRNIPFI